MASGGVEVRFNWMTSVLQSGAAFSVIALWLGHESTTTNHRARASILAQACLHFVSEDESSYWLATKSLR
jgi:hypothetical protein